MASLPPSISRGRWLFLLTLWITVAIVYVAAILPGSGAPSLGYTDKVDHIAAFFTVTLLARLSYLRRSIWPLIALIAAFGALIEISQMLPMIHRDAELADWVADMAASLVALAVAQPIVMAIRRYRTRQWVLAAEAEATREKLEA